MRSRSAVWVAFGAVHLAIAVVGVVFIPQESFWDLQLYRYWMWLGVHVDQWPVLDVAWVYPAGAMLPMLLAGIGGLGTGAGYLVAWCVMVTALDAAALALLLRRPNGVRAGLWWMAFVLLLGPVGMGRLDALIPPLVIVALLWALERPAIASALLTAGAWIKVAPGALVIPLFLAVRRPWRQVVAPAAGLSAIVLGTVVGFGGADHALSFLSEQGARGLQMEAPGATPWLLAALFTTRLRRWLNEDINTWEIAGPGTQGVSDVLGVLFALALVGCAVLLWWRRQRLGERLWTDRPERTELVVRGAMLMTLAMIVFNKVGSPQYMTWLAGPVVVALALGLPGWRRTAQLVLAIAGATQIIFPWLYGEIAYGGPGVTLLLALRNAALVVLLVWTVRSFVGRRDDELEPELPARAAAGTAAL